MMVIDCDDYNKLYDYNDDKEVLLPDVSPVMLKSWRLSLVVKRVAYESLQILSFCCLRCDFVTFLFGNLAFGL